ncbi:reverse transcriptase domain-containing protein [Tanacetum coccineum]
MEICTLTDEEAGMEEWTLYTDGASSLKGFRAGLGLNILRPFPEGPRELKFIIVAIDYFTKWTEAKPLAKTIGLNDHLILNYLANPSPYSLYSNRDLSHWSWTGFFLLERLESTEKRLEEMSQLSPHRGGRRMILKAEFGPYL